MSVGYRYCFILIFFKFWEEEEEEEKQDAGPNFNSEMCIFFFLNMKLMKMLVFFVGKGK